MPLNKEKLSEHCDKVAFGIVGVIILAMLAGSLTGEDRIQNSQADIKTATQKIDETKSKQPLIPTPEVPNLGEKVKEQWGAEILPPEPGHLFAMYREPAVVHLYRQGRTKRARHTAPSIKEISFNRSAEEKKCVVKVTFKLGELAKANLKSVTVLRKEAGSEKWREIGRMSAASSGQVKTFADKNAEPGKSYCYKVKSTASKADDVDSWDADSVALQESAVAPPEEEAPGYIVPYDRRMMLAQAQVRDLQHQHGTGWFNIDVYDYSEGKIRKLRMVKADEVIGKGTVTGEDLIDNTSYYLLLLREKNGEVTAILKHKEQLAKRLKLPRGEWVPGTIEVAEPWRPEGKEPKTATEPAVSTASGKDETGPASESGPTLEEPPGSSSEPKGETTEPASEEEKEKTGGEEFENPFE